MGWTWMFYRRAAQQFIKKKIQVEWQKLVNSCNYLTKCIWGHNNKSHSSAPFLISKNLWSSELIRTWFVVALFIVGESSFIRVASLMELGSILRLSLGGKRKQANKHNNSPHVWALLFPLKNILLLKILFQIFIFVFLFTTINEGGKC